jgi:hypothetical protein
MDAPPYMPSVKTSPVAALALSTGLKACGRAVAEGDAQQPVLVV